MTTAGTGGIDATKLRSGIERWENLQEQIDALKEDQKEIMASLKSDGYEVKYVRNMIKLRKLTQEERDQHDRLMEAYRAALGMLSDTPLGKAALERADPTVRKSSPDPTTEPAPAPTQAARPRGEVSAEGAAIDGATAQKAGKPVTANPFPAGPLRAAWDLGWCQEAGGTGMELPKDLRRSGRGRGASSAGASA